MPPASSWVLVALWGPSQLPTSAKGLHSGAHALTQLRWWSRRPALTALGVTGKPTDLERTHLVGRTPVLAPPLSHKRASGAMATFLLDELWYFRVCKGPAAGWLEGAGEWKEAMGPAAVEGKLLVPPEKADLGSPASRDWDVGHG